jgi:hypothetical protein
MDSAYWQKLQAREELFQQIVVCADCIRGNYEISERQHILFDMCRIVHTEK